MTTETIVRLVRYAHPDATTEARGGAWIEDVVVDVNAALGRHRPSGGAAPMTMTEVIEGGDALLDEIVAAAAAARAAGEGVQRDKVRLLVPIDRPGKILCFGRVYMGHIEVGGYEVPPRPNIFLKGANTLVGPDEAVILPYGWDRFTYGTELCIVVGRRTRRATEENAFEVVYGYTILNDVTARGEMQPKNKLFDTFAPLGPCIVPKRFIPEPSALSLVMHVNGELTQEGRVDSALWSLRRLIKDATEYITVETGDLISTGDLGAPDLVTAGDVLEASIAPIGVLRNPVIAEEEGVR